jgi:hypothetical protein
VIGFFFFISIGSVQISEWTGRPETPTVAANSPVRYFNALEGENSLKIQIFKALIL